MQQTNWYVIQVLTGSEETLCRDIKRLLDGELYEHCFVPMACRPHRKDGKFITLSYPLFPGYLFIVTDRIDEVSAALWTIAKFKRVLRTGVTFTPLEIAEVDVFRSLTDEAFNVALPKGYIAGDRIFVTEGPLQGHEGHIRNVDRHKRMAIVELPFMGGPRQVRLPLEIVEKR